MEIKYINNRDIQPANNNFLTNFRPSAVPRILRFPLQYSIFQTILTYGIVYNGFGIHSYYLQKTGSAMNFGPWARMKTLGSTFGKYFAVALPFFCIIYFNLDFKEVFCSLSYISTRDKPLIRKSIDYAFLQNLFSMALTFPIFYHFQKNLTKSLRGTLVIGVFAMINDLYIEKRREMLIERSYDVQELQKKKVQRNIQRLKTALQLVKDNKLKRRLELYGWQKLGENALKLQHLGDDVEQYRKKQMAQVTAYVREEMKVLNKIFSKQQQ